MLQLLNLPSWKVNAPEFTWAKETIHIRSNICKRNFIFHALAHCPSFTASQCNSFSTLFFFSSLITLSRGCFARLSRLSRWTLFEREITYWCRFLRRVCGNQRAISAKWIESIGPKVGQASKTMSKIFGCVVKFPPVKLCRLEIEFLLLGCRFVGSLRACVYATHATNHEYSFARHVWKPLIIFHS